MVPDSGCFDHKAIDAQGFCQFLEMLLVTPNDFVTGFLEGWGVEQAIAAKILVVVAHEQFHLGPDFLG